MIQKKLTYARVFWISLILSTFSNLQYGSNLFLPLFHGYSVGQDIDFYRFVFDFLWYVLSFITIYIGYRIGKDADIENEYQGLIKSLGAGWIASSLIFVPFYLSSDDVLRTIANVTTIYGFTGGYRVAAVLFSTMTIGWITRDGIRFKREWNPVILRPVLVYNGVLLFRALSQRVLNYTLLNSSNRAPSLWYMTVLSWVVTPFWIWYLVRMLSSGRRIDLKEEYGSVLYTIWVPSIVYSTLSYFAVIVFYYLRYQSLSMLEIPVAYGLKFVSSTLGVLGLPFGLLCYGYIHSRYHFNVQLNNIKDLEE